ncbi:paired amphipathic helix protein Sin3a-like [Rhincodon typus]|uniref:paired amphipathic helix protein Sin3a-like n=1 Tax=Rhincodon typus TaxID=259920 RepID=UPI00202F5AEF|nr:paired amphipathic helix protein Sin3a-like [Rhincodon typus]
MQYLQQRPVFGSEAGGRKGRHRGLIGYRQAPSQGWVSRTDRKRGAAGGAEPEPRGSAEPGLEPRMPGVNQGSDLEPPPSQIPQRGGAAMAKIQAHLQQMNHQVQAQSFAVQKQAQQQQFQRLKVEDALSYLDQVKMQFGNNPAVYNEFLDIMKEFKSQSIDTPGVIDRVSRLFQGHPDLILGFNAFLPPGYRIEIQKNKAVSVHGPAQTETQLLSEAAHDHASATPPSAAAPAVTPVSRSNPAQCQTPLMGHKDESAERRVIREEPTARALDHHDDPSSNEPHPVEFDNAISYVNKIKNRYLERPEVYKSFLEILHTYQKEQLIVKDTKGKPYCGMTEDEVFAKVANLFRGQEDLLTEFGQFLPDAKRSLFTGNAASEKDESKIVDDDDGSKHSQSKKRLRPALLPQVPPPLKVNTLFLTIAHVGKVFSSVMTETQAVHLQNDG